MGIIIHRSVHTQNYVVVANALARDTRLSFRARGLLVMLLSLPPDWHVTADMLAEDNPDSREGIRKAMTELRALGYVELITERGQDGRTRRHLEVFDADSTKRTLPAFGATRENTERGADGRTRRHLEVFDTPQPNAVRTAFGATCEDSASPQVAPNAGKPAVGIPAVKKKYGTSPARKGSARGSQKILSVVPAVTELCGRCGGKDHSYQDCPTSYCGEDFGTFAPGAEAMMKEAIDILAAQPDLTPAIAASEVNHIRGIVDRSYPGEGALDSAVREYAWRYLEAHAIAAGITYEAIRAEFRSDR
jgi:hypothetical protein